MARILIGDLPSAPSGAPGAPLALAGGAEALVLPAARAGAPPAPVGPVLDAAGWARADCLVQVRPERRPLPPDAFERCARLAVVVDEWRDAGRLLRLLAPVVQVALVPPAGVDVLRRLGFRDVRPLATGIDAALAEIAEAVDESPAAPRLAPRAAARLVAEQWRLAGTAASGTPLLHAAGASAAALARHDALVAAADDNPVAAEAATSLAIAAASHPERDPGLLLARADAARAAGLDGDAVWAAQAALVAATGPVDAPVAAADADWRRALDEAVLAAVDDDDAAGAVAAWVRARASYHLATLAPRSLPVARRLSLLASRRVDPAPLRAECAAALASAGRLDEARALLAEVLAERPDDLVLARRLAAWSALAVATGERVAWTWCRGDDLRAAIALHAAGALPADTLRIGCLPGADELGAAEACGSTPLVEVVVDAAGACDRWSRIAGATAVVARRDAPEAEIARALGREVVAPDAPPVGLHAAA